MPQIKPPFCRLSVSFYSGDGRRHIQGSPRPGMGVASVVCATGLAEVPSVTERKAVRRAFLNIMVSGMRLVSVAESY